MSAFEIEFRKLNLEKRDGLWDLRNRGDNSLQQLLAKMDAIDELRNRILRTINPLLKGIGAREFDEITLSSEFRK